jgi:hypothetical protein
VSPAGRERSPAYVGSGGELNEGHERLAQRVISQAIRRPSFHPLEHLCALLSRLSRREGVVQESPASERGPEGLPTRLGGSMKP